MVDDKERIEKERIEKLANYAGPDRVVSSITMDAMLKDLPPVTRNITGLPGLDTAIEGFEAGELIVISGPTSMGKTLLCSTIARNLNDGTKYALFFTFEVTPRKMIEDYRDSNHVIYLPLQHKAMDLSWLKDRVQEAILKYHVSAVFIDHLHYVVDMATPLNMSLEIGRTMRFIKRDICIGLNTSVFIVCHASKIPFGQEVTMDHLRDSSFVAQEADTVLIVVRRYDKDLVGKQITGSMLQGLATIQVAKARRTGNMGAKIKVKKEGHNLIESVGEPEESNEHSSRSQKRTSRESARYGTD
jgi:KaiC/GvpD/RAD55 family RecA-like ATPase